MPSSSANLPFDKNANPFAAIIRCTCDDEIDSKTISKWARALRYVSVNARSPETRLKAFMKGAGGVNALRCSLYQTLSGVATDGIEGHSRLWEGL